MEASKPLGKIKFEPVRASYEYLILLLISTGNDHGYQIIKRINALGIENLKLGPGITYPILKRLTELGLVKVRNDRCGKRVVKRYKVTEKGLRILLKTSIESFSIINTMFKIHIDLLLETSKLRITKINILNERFQEEMASLKKLLKNINEISKALIFILEKINQKHSSVC